MTFGIVLNGHAFRRDIVGRKTFCGGCTIPFWRFLRLHQRMLCKPKDWLLHSRLPLGFEGRLFEEPD